MAHYTEYPEINDSVLVQKIRRAIKNLISQGMDEDEISNFIHGQIIDHNMFHGGCITRGQLNRFLNENLLPSIDGYDEDILVEVI